MAMNQNPGCPPVNIPNPTRIKPKMGGAPTPKWDPIIGIDPQPYLARKAESSHVWRLSIGPTYLEWGCQVLQGQNYIMIDQNDHNAAIESPNLFPSRSANALDRVHVQFRVLDGLWQRRNYAY